MTVAGLQAERTALAWTRTSLAVLANGALLLLRDSDSHPGIPGMFAAGCAGALALVIYLIGVRRQRLLAHRPLPQRISPRREVYLTSIAVAALVVISVLPLVA